jgi:hypothetical protein
MAKVTNLSPRMVHLAGVMCSPGRAMEVPDAMLEKQGVKDMIEAGELAVGQDADRAADVITKKVEASKAADAAKK